MLSIFVWWILDIKYLTFCHELVSICDRASSFTDQRMSSLPIRAKFSHFEQFENKHRTILWLCFQIHLLEVVIIPSVDTVYNFSVFLIASSQYLSTHFWTYPLTSWNHATGFAWGFSRPGKLSVAPAEIRDLNIIGTQGKFRSVYIHVECTPKNGIKKWCWFAKIVVFIDFVHMEIILCFLPAIESTIFENRWERCACFRWTKRHSQCGIFLNPGLPNRTSSNCLSHKRPAKGDHTSFVREEPLGLTCWTINFAVIIYEADDPCSVNTAYAPESSFSVSPRSTPRPWYLWYFASNSALLRWQMSSM